MNKIIKLIAVFIVANMLMTTATATPVFQIEVLDQDTEPLLEKANEIPYSGYWFEMNGEKYLVGQGGSRETLPVKWRDDFPDNWPARTKSIQYIEAGDYYMVRYSGTDSGWWTNGVFNYTSFPVWFYDKNYNLIAEHTFDKRIVSSLGYYNGTYYCGLFGEEKLRKSTDMVNWEETDEELPRQTESGQTYTEHQVSFDQTSPLIPVVYEDQGERELMSTLGEWLFLRDKEKSTKDEAFYLSNDNIYFAKIELPYCTINHDGRKHLDQYGNLDGFIYQDQCLNIIHPGEIRRLSINCIYEYNDNIIIDATSGLHVGKLLRLTVPKADIYAELEAQKAAPYVQLNGSILGFEETPVIENDRILVPMRFLFEQMGAEVEWDNDTQTATVLQESDEIAFQINNLSANVNSQPQTMDVPARLINDKTMIPLRFLSEHLGYTVEWDGTNNMAIVTQASPQ